MWNFALMCSWIAGYKKNKRKTGVYATWKYIKRKIPRTYSKWWSTTPTMYSIIEHVFALWHLFAEGSRLPPAYTLVCRTCKAYKNHGNVFLHFLCPSFSASILANWKFSLYCLQLRLNKKFKSQSCLTN